MTMGISEFERPAMTSRICVKIFVGIGEVGIIPTLRDSLISEDSEFRYLSVVRNF